MCVHHQLCCFEVLVGVTHQQISMLCRRGDPLEITVVDHRLDLCVALRPVSWRRFTLVLHRRFPSDEREDGP